MVKTTTARRSAVASIAVAATIAVMTLGIGPAMAAERTGTTSCGSIVNVTSTTAGSSGNVLHWWDNLGGGYKQWFTPGTHQNNTNAYYINWHVSTVNFSIASALGGCSGIA